MRLTPLARAASVVALCAALAGSTMAAKSGAPADPAAVAVAAARAELGDPYAWGGSGPDAWDCSGLVQAAWRKAGVTGVPRVSRQQHAWAVPVPREQVLPGDLVFFGEPVNHVGLVTTVTPTAVRMVDSGATPSSVVERLVWKQAVVRYGRVPRPGMPAVRATPAPGVPPLTLPARTQSRPSSAIALRAAALARAAVGRPDPGDAVFVRDAWRAAGGRVLPGNRAALAAAGTPVPFADARVGDLVVYAAPAAHVGVYVGEGLMVGASRSKGKVVLRQVWESPGLSLVRLPG